MSTYSEIDKALKNYFKAYIELKRLNITTNKKDFTSQIGEWLVCELYGGKRAEKSIQKDWDVIVDNKFVQVKTHAKAETNGNRWTGIEYGEDAQIDELTTVVFTHDYKLREFYRTPWREAYLLVRHNSDRSLIRWDDLRKYKVAIDTLPNQDLVSLFKL